MANSKYTINGMTIPEFYKKDDRGHSIDWYFRHARTSYRETKRFTFSMNDVCEWERYSCKYTMNGMPVSAFIEHDCRHTAAWYYKRMGREYERTQRTSFDEKDIAAWEKVTQDFYDMFDGNTSNQSRTRLKNIFKYMKRRCYNKNDGDYPSYGGRGIQICNEWLGNQENFISWAMDNGYNDKATIDRIDPDKGYEPENCRWLSMKDNCLHACISMNERRKNRKEM